MTIDNELIDKLLKDYKKPVKGTRVLLKAGIPFRGASPHPLNAAREIQRRTMRTPENYVTLGPALGQLWSTFPFLFLFVENRPFTHRNRQDAYAVATHLFGEVQSRVALGSAGRRRHASRNRQAITILHQQMAGVAQLRFFAFALAAQHRIRISSRLMSFVRALLAVKVHCRVAGIISWRLVLLILRLEAFQTGRCFQQRAVNREVLITEQFMPARLVQHAREELLGDVPAQQPFPILREGGRIPDAVVHVQADEPAKEHIVIQLFHQQPLTAHPIEHMQQQRSQQLLQRDRGPTHPRIKLIELRRQLYKHGIGNLAYRAQRMVLRHSLLWRQITEHSCLLKIVSAHWFSFSWLRDCTTRSYYVGPCAKVTFSAAC